MFGYLKLDDACPQVLKDTYKKYYCFLCRSLQRHYGFLARFLLSYDVAFFLILCVENGFLDAVDEVACFGGDQELKDRLQAAVAKKIAALSVQLATAKLEDDIIDDNKFKAKLGKWVFSSAFKKAKKDFPLMWEIIDGEYLALREMEKAGETLSVIEAQFSKMMTRVAKECLDITDEARLAILEAGSKWIYFIDAVDDIDDNIAEKTFNPLVEFGSFDALKNEHYMYLAKHFNAIRKKAHHLSGGVEARIINRLIDTRMVECTVDVLTKRR